MNATTHALDIGDDLDAGRSTTMNETSLAEFLGEAHARAMADLTQPGDWLTARQRAAAWEQVRDSATNPLDAARREALSPMSVEGSHPAVEDLTAEAVEVIHRVSSDPGRLTRSWADDMIAALGEETYTELVGLCAITMVLDRFAVATGEVLPTLDMTAGGDPSRVRPDDVGDVGAWVSQALDGQRANVSRTLSLVPLTNASWRVLVDSHYSRGMEFFALEWDRALSRPQVELIAARTTALNECFY